MKVEGTPSGCLEWDGSYEKDDFIYVCPYCAWSAVEPSPVCVELFTTFQI